MQAQSTGVPDGIADIAPCIMLADFSRNCVLKSILRKIVPGGVPSNSIARNLRVARSSIRSRSLMNCASRWLGLDRAFQIIHGGGRDGARYLPLAVYHRKQHDHPVELAAEKSTTCERHWTYSLKSYHVQVNRPTIVLPD